MTGQCAYCSSTLVQGRCPTCDQVPRAMWSTGVAGVIALAGVGLFVLTLFVLVVLAAMTRRG